MSAEFRSVGGFGDVGGGPQASGVGGCEDTSLEASD